MAMKNLFARDGRVHLASEVLSPDDADLVAVHIARVAREARAQNAAAAADKAERLESEILRLRARLSELDGEANRDGANV